jgi:hypothetical protein
VSSPAQESATTDDVVLADAAAVGGRSSGGRLQQLRLKRRSQPSAEGGGEVGALDAEVALLREENARLKMGRHRTPDAGDLLEMLGRITENAGRGEDAQDEETSILVEMLVLKETMLTVVSETERALESLRRRLETTLPAADEDHDVVALATSGEPRPLTLQPQPQPQPAALLDRPA